MTKTLTIILLFIATSFYGQTFLGGLRLQAYEKSKDPKGNLLLVNEPVTFTLNDSTKYNLTTDDEGYADIKDLKPGSYSVSVGRKDCQTTTVRDIKIGEGKTAYVTFNLTCLSYINSLTKKERKKLGYK